MVAIFQRIFRASLSTANCLNSHVFQRIYLISSTRSEYATHPVTRTLSLNLTRFFFSLQTLNRLHSTDSTSSLLSMESTFAAGVAGAAGAAFSARCARTWCGWKAHLGSPVCSVASVPTATVVGEGRRGGGGKNDGTEYNNY